MQIIAQRPTVTLTQYGGHDDEGNREVLAEATLHPIAIWKHIWNERHIVVTDGQAAKVRRLVKQGYHAEKGDHFYTAEDAGYCPHCVGPSTLIHKEA